MKDLEGPWARAGRQEPSWMPDFAAAFAAQIGAFAVIGTGRDDLGGAAEGTARGIDAVRRRNDRVTHRLFLIADLVTRTDA